MIDAIKKTVENQISETVQTEIDKKVKEFHEELTYRKDKYIAEVMKGIRIYSERDHCTDGMNYKIIFENITKIKVE